MAEEYPNALLARLIQSVSIKNLEFYGGNDRSEREVKYQRQEMSAPEGMKLGTGKVKLNLPRRKDGFDQRTS
jgi:hypothetical protein